jgi:nickel/cobalt transporter (NiCoT) family protein
LLGYAVIGIFLLSWIGSVVFYKLMRYDDIETSAVWASRR